MSEHSTSSRPLALVIDDDDIVRLLVRQTLETAAIAVAEAQSGEQGLEALARVRPDIVLLDVMTSGRDGFEVCTEIRALPASQRTPVLMMTGHDDTESVNRAYEVGATDFITKPIPWPILAHRVRYMLRASQSLERLARSEARLAEAQRLAQLGHWDWDLASNEVYRSPELLRILGATPESSSSGYRGLIEMVHASERGELERALRRALNSAQPYSLECRIVRADGTQRVVHERAVADCDDNGAVIRIHGTTQDITEHQHAEQQIRHLAMYDTLTDLPNRQFFKEQLGHSIAHVARWSQKLAVIVLDLDRFKRINDTLGRNVGDQLLAAVSARLTQSLRSADHVTRVDPSPLPGNVARLGGDEFTVQLTGLAQAADAGKVARRILSALAQPFTLNGHEIVVTASAGIAVYPCDGEDADTLLKNADSAMYHAKDHGKDDYQYFSPSMNASALRKLTLESQLRKATERGELLLHYQPKVEIGTHRIAGIEALIRWQHPELGMIAPADFIPLAEETGLIVPIGDWVLAQACRQAAAWRAAGLPRVGIAVNMSSTSFAQKDFVAKVAAALDDAKLDARAIDIELTESVLMRDAEAARATLCALKEHGVGLSIDDFGTGYSSLAYLRRFPIDTLKIDRSFVRDVIDNPEDAAIIAAIIALGNSLGLAVVAEGVESEEQAALLHARGCTLMQGYLFSRPVAADDITIMLVTERLRRRRNVAA
ncbi:MAG: EAL domain-containing protein [Burkholderiales bacterium]|nr:EAL domain-containing protein [Burkholderiales bacterium]